MLASRGIKNGEVDEINLAINETLPMFMECFGEIEYTKEEVIFKK